MRYTEVKIYTEPEGIDPLTCILMDMGIAGFAVDDARDVQDLMNRKNVYDWDYIDESLMRPENRRASVTFYLNESEEDGRTLRLVREKLGELKTEKEHPAQAHGRQNGNIDSIDYGQLEIVCKTVDDSDWKDNWKEYFKPVRITERIVVKPTWEDYDRKGDELVIEIDPGMAFGTGAHPTTTLCIKLLEKYIEPETDTVLDAGSGSGILAVAAALLGAREVLAVDIDPVAVEISGENAKRNRLSGKITVREGDLTKGLNMKADIIAANLTADLVIMLARDAAAHLKGKGIYISSGILAEKREQVAAVLKESGFCILDILEEGEWCAVAARLY